MKRWLQHFSFKQSAYDRPNQKWICGRECEGKPCPLGPDLRGDCQATYECHPHRLGDRWICNRPRQGAGETSCEPGPSPEGVCGCPIPKCSPGRSLRSLRGLTTLATIAFSIGLLLLLLASDRGREFMTPGELSNAHSMPGGACSDCHSLGEDKPIHWLKAGAPDQSKRCLECHQLGDSPMNPHSLPAGQLAEWSRSAAAKRTDSLAKAPARVAMSEGFGNPMDHNDGQIECAACHVEHQGKDHDLTRVANDRCQVCHQNQFTSFADGHPSFGDYPFKHRTRIVFDHQKHFRQHFKNEEGRPPAPESCLACHDLDDKGGLMLVKPFEQSCAACHNKDFPGFGHAGSPIPFLRAPLFDVEGFEDAEMSVGEWPDDWDSLETTLPPFTLFLMSDDEMHRKAVAQLGAKDLDVIDEDLQTAGFQLGWGFKEMLHDISEKGLPEIERRIEASLGRPLASAERAALESSVSPEMIAATASRWFPNLAAEVASHRAGNSPKAAFMDLDDMEDRLSPDPAQLGKGWVRTDADLTLGYQPSGHSDDFMTLWLSLARDASKGGAPHAANRMFASLAGNREKVAAGRCMKCHTAGAHTVSPVNWRAKRPDPHVHQPTHFSHSAHFSLLDEKNCFTCHRLNFAASPDDYLAAFEYHSPDETKGAVCNFRAINKWACASCHTKGMAGENCLTCHNYHAGSFESAWPKGALFRSTHPDPAPK